MFAAFLILCFTSQGILEAAIDPTLPTCPRDWQVEVVATAPTIVHPSVVTCAPDGRVFVAEDPMDISTPSADMQLGRILCLHPGGKITVFADKLYAVFGMQYLDGKLFVLHNPKFSVWRDDDGVGKDRVDLIEQTNPKPWALNWNDHIPANFKLAMDGYFYIAVGDKGLYGAIGKDGKRVDMRGGILRMRPNGTGLEVFATGLRNILDVAINAEDDIFTYDNTDERDWWSRLTHIVDGGYYGYPYEFKPLRSHALPPMADYGGGAATGTLCYNEDALPPEYHGNLFLADFGRRQVMRLRIARDGATYKVVEREEDLLNGPPEFRPVGIAWAPDGLGMYVCDWNHRDDKENVKVGRLLKVTYAGKSHATPKPSWYVPAAMKKEFHATTDELIQGLSHPAQSVRMVAQLRLVDRAWVNSRVAEKEAVTRLAVTRRFGFATTNIVFSSAEVRALGTLIENQKASASARVHALWALDEIGVGQNFIAAIRRAAKDKNSEVSLQALRQLGTRHTGVAADEVISALRDTSAPVRFQAATALGRLGNQATVSASIEMLDEPDRFVRHAVFTSLNRIGRNTPKAWTAIAQGLENRKPAIREGTLLAMRESYEEPVLSVLLKFIRSRSQPAETRAQALEILASMHRQLPEWKGEWWAYHPVDKPPPEKTVAWAGTPTILAALRELLNDPQPLVRRASVEGLRTAKENSAAPRLRELFAREIDWELKRSVLQTLAEFKDTAAKGLVLAVLEEPHRNSALLLDAMAAGELIAGNELTTVLMNLLKNPAFNSTRPGASEVLLKAIQTLGNLKANEALPLLADQLSQSPGAIRLAAIAALAQIGGERVATVLLPMLREPDVATRRATIAALGKLKNKTAVSGLLVAFSNEETRFDAASALAQMPDVRALDAYLFGLASANVVVRDNCRKAIKAVAADALPVIVSRLESSGLTPPVVNELQQLYRDIPAAKDSRIFEQTIKAREPADYMDFALKNNGDAERGRKLFYDPNGLACVRCHSGDHQGGDVGPSLASIGAQYGRQQLAESILYPSKVVRDGYQQEILALRDGEEIAGALKGETADVLIVQDTAGTKHHLRKTDIKERRASTLSLMPDGLHAGMSLEEFSDLISYLESLRAKSGAAEKP